MLHHPPPLHYESIIPKCQYPGQLSRPVILGSGEDEGMKDVRSDEYSMM